MLSELQRFLGMREYLTSVEHADIVGIFKEPGELGLAGISDLFACRGVSEAFQERGAGRVCRQGACPLGREWSDGGYSGLTALPPAGWPWRASPH